MSNWREKIWLLRAAALTIAGVFVFFGITSFLIPIACADEITPYNQDTYQAMPVLNPNSWQAPPAVMPPIPATASTNPNGKITIVFTSDNLFADQLNDLWARVTYDGRAEYWDLDPGMLAADGKSLSIQFESKFDGKTLRLEFYAFNKEAKQTGFSNPIDILVNSSPSTITMPTLPAAATTDPNGKLTLNFTSGSLFANQLNDLWARVIYDGKTEYWDLDPGMLAADGKSLAMQFESKFDAKILRLEFYAFDKEGKQTGFGNPIEISVNSGPSSVAMPNLPASSITDDNNKATLNFVSGSLSAQELLGLRAHVSYDDKKEDWKLDPGMLADNGKSITLTFEPKFDNNLLKMDLYGFDNTGKQIDPTNSVEITVKSGPNLIVMPLLPATATTDVDGKIAINFTSGSLAANELSDLWVRVNYDGKTEYWKLNPGLLAGDGKSLNMQFEPKFEGKVMKLEFYAFDKQGKQTGFTNPIEITVSSSPSSLTIPTLPSGIKTGPNGNFTVNFISGTLLASQLNELWARVSYDNKTEQWDLDPGILSADGKAISMQIEPKFDAKTLKFELYGFDTAGKQTGFSNPIEITVNSSPSPVTMPTIPSTGTTDVNGIITINFTSGLLFNNQLSDLWAKVIYDNKTEYWNLDPGMLASDGKSLSMQLESKFDGKTLRLEFYGFDIGGKQTSFTNPIEISIISGPSSIVMPTLSAAATTSPTGKITLNFSSGSLFSSQLSDLWARVFYDNKTEYWDLDPGMLAADGKSLNLQFASQFDAKVLRLEFYGFDIGGKQTSFTNPIEISINY